MISHSIEFCYNTFKTNREGRAVGMLSLIEIVSSVIPAFFFFIVSPCARIWDKHFEEVCLLECDALQFDKQFPKF
jgi:hypothetical protein